MRKKREYLPGVAYHVVSRTNNKIRVFENKLGRKIMLMVLQDAKEKFGFRLHNFCIMPTHIHLLLTPSLGANISEIMHWIKTSSAKMWNRIHGSCDHLWGSRFFARPARNLQDFFIMYNYIDRNPVEAGFVYCPTEWKASGAYYILNGDTQFMDYVFFQRQLYIKFLPENNRQK